MITYLLHSTLLLSGFTLFYWFVLRHETYFKLNRWTIMLSIVLCLMLPFISIPASLSLWSNHEAPTETIINTITQAPAVFDFAPDSETRYEVSSSNSHRSADESYSTGNGVSFWTILSYKNTNPKENWDKS